MKINSSKNQGHSFLLYQFLVKQIMVGRVLGMLSLVLTEELPCLLCILIHSHEILNFKKESLFLKCLKALSLDFEYSTQNVQVSTCE
jgi:hypothetical protein